MVSICLVLLPALKAADSLAASLIYLCLEILVNRNQLHLLVAKSVVICKNVMLGLILYYKLNFKKFFLDGCAYLKFTKSDVKFIKAFIRQLLVFWHIVLCNYMTHNHGKTFIFMGERFIVMQKILLRKWAFLINFVTNYGFSQTQGDNFLPTTLDKGS